ncbi:MAG: D-2-hydroxyacid dehydrogenase [Lentisphaeria bacterium]|jgi:glycerate dehydrogenase
MNPRIVVLDGYTLNPGDLDWGPLAALGELTVHERTPAAEAVARAQGAAAVLTNKVVLDRATLGRLPGLRYVGVLATGYNVVDTEAARERGITVTNVPAYSTPSVAQATFALLLELANRTALHDAAVKAGRWSHCPDFTFRLGTLVELAGLTFGIYGMGAIGQAVARVAQGFGMAVLAVSRTPKELPGVRWVDHETLFRESDVVSLHCPLTPETKELVDAATLALMKPTAYLLNCGRGPLVNEADLAAALNAGRLAGFGADVLSTEPPRADNPLLAARNTVITPHIAWATDAARRRLLATVVANLRAFLAGTPQNVVN